MATRTTQKNTYADKFFQKMKPGIMGDGFVGIVTDTRKEKPDHKIFPTMDEMMEDD